MAPGRVLQEGSEQQVTEPLCQVPVSNHGDCSGGIPQAQGLWDNLTSPSPCQHALELAAFSVSLYLCTYSGEGQDEFPKLSREDR